MCLLLKFQISNNKYLYRIKKYLFKNNEVDKKRKDKKIVEILMEQKKNCGLGSGLGNYLVAEILYYAKISPFKTIYEIYSDRAMSDRLSDSIEKVVKSAYKTSYVGYLDDADEEFAKYVKKLRKNIDEDKDYIYNFHPDIEVGDVFQFNVYGQKQDPKGNPVKKDKIIKGRTTYWVPDVQK